MRRKIGTASDAAKSFELLKILARRQPRVAHVVKTCNTCETHVIIRVPAVIKTWWDAVRHESLGICQGQSTVIGRVLRVGITGNSLCLAGYHWQKYFSVPRQCFSLGTAADGHTPSQSKAKPKLTKNYHLRPRPPDFHNFLYVIKTWSSVWPGLYRYKKSLHRDKMVWQLSHFYNGNNYTWKKMVFILKGALVTYITNTSLCMCL